MPFAGLAFGGSASLARFGYFDSAGGGGSWITTIVPG
jgi:hypothetical protein